MLNAIPVSLVPHDPAWADRAQALADQLRVLGDCLLEVHHIGSTSVPGMVAKPIIVLLPVVTDLAAFDGRMDRVEALGYDYYGEYGIPDRRFFALQGNGTRLVHLHFFEQGSDQIAHNLAFRDYMRAHPDVAVAYGIEKQRARVLFPEDSHAYTREKADFIVRTAVDAHAWYASQQA
ncbi:MAG: GrpB family protein [Sandarakinorhabdus sp.]|nr:GrpB family protein [Sandarakinorhabdus sp.]